jgi:hypothetical protein
LQRSNSALAIDAIQIDGFPFRQPKSDPREKGAIVRTGPAPVSDRVSFHCAKFADFFRVRQQQGAVIANLLVKSSRQAGNLLVQSGAQQGRLSAAQFTGPPVLEEGKYGAHGANDAQ